MRDYVDDITNVLEQATDLGVKLERSKNLFPYKMPAAGAGVGDGFAIAVIPEEGEPLAGYLDGGRGRALARPYLRIVGRSSKGKPSECFKIMLAAHRLLGMSIPDGYVSCTAVGSGPGYLGVAPGGTLDEFAFSLRLIEQR